ncbi:MAG: fibronectin type III domain-containing protein [Chloroflexota bacterium]
MHKRATKPAILSFLIHLSLIGLLAGSLLPTSAAMAQSDDFCDTVTEIPGAECRALVALYNNTNGAQWFNNAGWFENTTPCSWYGIECYNQSPPTNISFIFLMENGLRGQIPPELGDISRLRQLQLYTNQLSGPIPVELSYLTQLRDLRLYENQLDGSIPAELSRLPNLLNLVLTYNQLSGSIPAELGLIGTMVYLDLAGNQLSGPIPSELGDLSNLGILSLGENLLSGPIPAELGQLGKLKRLMLGDNQLSGEIPAELGELANLEWLTLQDNQLSGVIPPDLGDLPRLQRLQLYNNYLSGSIPPELGQLSRLNILALFSNLLDGTIPAELGNLTNLTTLHLFENALEGEIPASLTNLVNLQKFSLNFNKLSASDPATVQFLDERNPAWSRTQTVPPEGLQITGVAENSIELSWTPIRYTWNGGYYEIYFAESLEGPYTRHGVTADKTASSYLANGLEAGKTYYFKVRTFTPAFETQKNNLWSDFSQVVSAAYNPEGSLVTGGGWITSPAGAYPANPSVEGKANFGFESKIKPNGETASGTVEFQLKTGELRFHSQGEQSLAFTESGQAIFSGYGALNGELAPNGQAYRFTLWVNDGAPDTLRIKIWYQDGDLAVVIYDNAADQPIEGGNIVIHHK